MTRKFNAVSAIWRKVEDNTAPLGYWMKPGEMEVHPLKAVTWKEADKEVEKLVLPDGRKLWAYGEKAVENCLKALEASK